MLDDNEFEPACPCGCGATLESVAGHTDSSSNDEIEHDPYIETYNDEDDEYYEELDEDDFISEPPHLVRGNFLFHPICHKFYRARRAAVWVPNQVTKKRCGRNYGPQ